MGLVQTLELVRNSTRVMRLLSVFIFMFVLFGGRTAQAQTVPAHDPAVHNKVIRSIRIEVQDIFDKPTNTIYRTANQVKMTTKDKVVRRELLFKEGDHYDPFRVAESIRALRELRFLRNIKITPTFEGDFVDLLVTVQDTWTLIPQFSYSGGTGRSRKSVGLAESDMLGLGNRLEALYADDDGRKLIQGVYDSPRIWDSSNRLLLGYFDRTDGNREVFLFGRPYRSLVQKTAWSSSGDFSDLVGRLFQNGDERYIFRQKVSDFQLRFSRAKGNPESYVRRYSLGYGFQEAEFSQAKRQDYSDLNLNPKEVSNDPAFLPENRRFSGPVFNYQHIIPDYISKNYVDRFERVEDYNLGPEESINLFTAPKVLGSIGDAVLFSANASQGHKIDSDAFTRSEFGVATRFDQEEFNDSLFRFETHYYNVFGPLHAWDYFLGKHTLALSFFLDLGYNLDRDRELLLGADNALRGYDAKTFTGDKRMALNIEQRMHFIDDAWHILSVGGALFLDVGGASTEPLGSILSNEIYSDVGAGLRLAFPRSSGERVVRIDVAVPLRDGPDGSDAYSPRILFSGGQLFGGRLRSETLGPEKASVEVGFDR